MLERYITQYYVAKKTRHMISRSSANPLGAFNRTAEFVMGLRPTVTSREVILVSRRLGFEARTVCWRWKRLA